MDEQQSKKSSRIFKQNRELSWLKFNDRVLDEAADPTVPLLERLRFVTIFTTNLDEFFRVRVGSLIDLMAFKKNYSDNKTGMTAKEQLHAIYKECHPLYLKRERLFFDLEHQLREHGIARRKFDELSGEEKNFIQTYFQDQVFPMLSPFIIDAHHPFLHLPNKQIHIIAVLKNHEDPDQLEIAIIPVPNALPEVVYLPGREVHYIAIEDLLLEMTDTIFDTYDVVEKVQICITRNADIHAEDEDFDVEDDFRKVMKQMLNQRKHLAPVRLELSGIVSDRLMEYLKKKFGLHDRQIFTTMAPLRLNYAYPLSEHLSPKQEKLLTYRPFLPQQPASVDPKRSIREQLETHDIFLSYPYESMDPFIRLVEEASNDPDVISISITIYRLASKSRLVDALCHAAEAGKEVTALIELRARFDEQNNIDWSKKMERAGCNIIYGIQNYKVHSKLCLITYRSNSEIKFITQVGTGNYNEKTAKLYTDLCLMTKNKAIGRDARIFFQNMGIGNLFGQYKELLVSPVSLKTRVMEMMDQEIAKGDNCRMFFKMNSLTDKDLIDKLQEASAAGVKIRMIIRGISCLRPGLEGYTENIEIRSIVGRYLEHSRIYSFGTGSEEKLFIASADFMTRNTERRVEVGAPVYDPEVKKKIHQIIDIQWKDTLKARRMTSDGTYEKIEGDPWDAQSEQMNLAILEGEEHRMKVIEKEQKNSTDKMRQNPRNATEVPVHQKKGFFGRLFRK